MDGKYFNEVVKVVVNKRQLYHLIIENNTPYTHKLITGVWLKTLIILQNIYKHRFIIKDTKSILNRYYIKPKFFHKIKFEIHFSNAQHSYLQYY